MLSSPRSILAAAVAVACLAPPADAYRVALNVGPKEGIRDLYDGTFTHAWDEVARDVDVMSYIGHWAETEFFSPSDGPAVREAIVRHTQDALISVEVECRGRGGTPRDWMTQGRLPPKLRATLRAARAVPEERRDDATFLVLYNVQGPTAPYLSPQELARVKTIVGDHYRFVTIVRSWNERIARTVAGFDGVLFEVRIEDYLNLWQTGLTGKTPRLGVFGWDPFDTRARHLHAAARWALRNGKSIWVQLIARRTYRDGGPTPDARYTRDWQLALGKLRRNLGDDLMRRPALFLVPASYGEQSLAANFGHNWSYPVRNSGQDPSFDYRDRRGIWNGPEDARDRTVTHAARWLLRFGRSSRLWQPPRRTP